MSEKKIVLKISSDSEEAVSSVKTLRQEIKKANDEAQRIAASVGQSGPEFTKAVARVAELRDEFAQYNKTVNAFNPDNKLQAIVGVARGAVGAVQGITGAMSLMGIESENSVKTIEKLNALMAVSSSLETITDIKDAFSDLGKVIQSSTIYQKAMNASTMAAAAIQKLFTGSVMSTSTSFKVLRGAIMATGIGLLVVAVGALIANFDSVKKAVLNLIPGLGHVADFIGNLINSVTDFIGVTSEAERESARLMSIAEKNLERMNFDLKTNGYLYDKYTNQKRAADVSYKEAKLALDKEETLSEAEKQRRAQELLKKRNFDINQADKDRLTDAQAAQEKINSTNKAAADKAASEAKANRDKVNQAIADERKQTLANIKEANKVIADSKRTQEEIELNDIQTKYAEQIALAKKNNQSIVELELALQTELDKVREDWKKTNAEKDQKEAEEAKAEAERLREEYIAGKVSVAEAAVTVAGTLVNNTILKNKKTGDGSWDDQRNDLDSNADAVAQERDARMAAEIAAAEGNEIQLANIRSKYALEELNAAEALSEAKKAIDEAEKNAKLTNLELVSGAVSAASNLLGQETVAGKALAVASTTIDTYVGAQRAYISQMKAGGPGAPIRAALAATSAVLIGLANVKKILSVKVPAKGGAGSGGEGGALPSSTAPVINSQITSNNGQPQEVSVVNQRDQVIRAYISDRDLKNNEQRANFLNNLSNI